MYEDERVHGNKSLTFSLLAFYITTVKSRWNIPCTSHSHGGTFRVPHTHTVTFCIAMIQRWQLKHSQGYLPADKMQANLTFDSNTEQVARSNHTIHEDRNALKERRS